MTRKWANLKKSFRTNLVRLGQDCSGGLLAYTALFIPVLFGLVGLSVDVGTWYAHARMAQSAADSAAIAGSLEVVRSSSDPAQITAAALAQAANSGFNVGNGDTVTVNMPPLAGPNAGSADYVEVVIVRLMNPFFSSIVFNSQPQVAARAVALARNSDTCVWALNPSASGAVSISGSADVNLACGILANSTSNTGLTQNGAGCLTASEIKVVGNYSVSCSTPEPQAGAFPTIDPLAALSPPSYGACDYSADITVNGNQSATLIPGTYCGNIEINGNANVTFDPGLYVLNGAAITFNGQSTANGVDVSFYLTGNSGENDSITINGGATVSLSAPSDGPLPGVLFFQDRTAPSNVTHRFNGNAVMDFDGILYFPNQTLEFSGSSVLQNSEALFIADTVAFNGNTIVGLQTPLNPANPLLIQTSLVE